MNKIVHFEIVAVDPQRAITFYEKALGWKFEKFDSIDVEYWSVITTPPNTPGAINGGLRREMGTDVKERTKSVNGFVNFIVVEVIDDLIEKIKSNGGELLNKMTVPKVGILAYCYDTEGNVIGLIQPESM